MSITPIHLYWITRLDHVHNFLGVVGVILGIGLVVAICATVFCVIENADDGKKLSARITVILASVFAALGILSVFIPTTNELAAIQVIPAIASSQTLSNLTSCTVDLAKEWLQELRPKGKESK